MYCFVLYERKTHIGTVWMHGWLLQQSVYCGKGGQMMESVSSMFIINTWHTRALSVFLPFSAPPPPLFMPTRCHYFQSVSKKLVMHWLTSDWLKRITDLRPYCWGQQLLKVRFCFFCPLPVTACTSWTVNQHHRTVRNILFTNYQHMSTAVPHGNIRRVTPAEIIGPVSCYLVERSPPWQGWVNVWLTRLWLGHSQLMMSLFIQRCPTRDGRMTSNQCHDYYLDYN